MYKFSVWNFNDKEIDQIVTLVKQWASGSGMPIDRRKFTRNVIDYARARGIIALGDHCRKWNGELEWYVRSKKRYYINSDLGKFHPRWCLPQEAIYRLVKPMLEKHSGFSITSNKGWHDLNIYCSKDHLFTNKSIEEMMDILNLLASWGYLIFQYAGSIWCITETPERAVRSEL